MENISNFTKGCDFYVKNYSQEELYEFLNSGSDMEKQLACLRIESLSTTRDAEIFMKNLTGVDGKIREAVSFKLKNFMQNPRILHLFNREEFYEIFLNAIIDINGNICRNVISAISNLKDYENFSQYFKKEIISRAFNVIKKLEKFSYKDKKYVTNKELFKLYWYLETLLIFEFDDMTELLNLLKECIKIEEYTIQEKIANLRFKLPFDMRKELKINKDNYYVNMLINNDSLFSVGADTQN